MTRARAVLIGALATGAIFIPAASQASASTLIVWGLEYCIPVLGTMGGWTSGTCQSPAASGGGWARAIVTLTGLLYACLYVGAGFGMLSDPGCTALGLPSAFLVFGDPPALTIKVKGGAYKFKGKISGIEVSIGCKSMEASEPEIESGDKKTAAKTKASSLVFNECTVEKPAIGCKVNSGKISSGPVESELVENSSKTKVENLFKPQSGSTFAEPKFEGCSNEALNATYKIEGTVLAEGGAADEISKVSKNSGEEDGEAVEKPKLIFEASSKKYIEDETGEEKEAGLKLAGNAMTLTGEATAESHFGGATFKSLESSEEVVVAEGTADLGLDRE